MCSAEGNRCTPPAQLVPVAVTAAKYVSAETYFALEGTTVACPAAFDVLTHPRIDLIEGSGYLVGSQEVTHWGHRLVKEDRPGQQP